jgi:putative methionine-R-sulfoxide reductase with GAF domain
MCEAEDSRKALDALLTRLKGVQSYIFYVRDPLWDDELRLVYMDGVRVQEPMHGFLFPSASRDRIAQGSDFEWIPFPQENWRFRDEFQLPLKDLAIRNKLFGGFATRENVLACARLTLRKGDSGGTPDAVMFVNFDQSGNKEDCERPLRDTMEQLCGSIASIRSQLETHSTVTLRKLARVFAPTERLARLEFGDLDAPDSLKNYFCAVLESLMAALAVEDGVGTLHLYDAATHDLTLQARIGTTADIPETQSAANGEGVIAWVALKRRALLIEDLATSPFGSPTPQFTPIHIRVRDDIRSELAVPMVLHDQILGVLNLEASEQGHFRPEHVRTLWYAANQAAIACQLCRQTTWGQLLHDRLQSLLHVCQDVVEREDASPLNELAELFRKSADADMCDVWHYNSRNEEFGGAGVSECEAQLALKPRQTGWSRHIIALQRPVWIHSIHSPANFSTEVWNPERSRWEVDEERPGPGEIHQSLDTLDVKCEFGVPITVRQDPIGIAWLKYHKERKHPPSHADVSRALALSANVGLVMDFLERYEESSRGKEQAIEDNILGFQKGLFGKDALETEELSLYVKSKPHGARIGGDFFHLSFLDEDERRLAVIIGDGEGHAIPGALQMLPLFTAFSILYRQTTSTHYVLEKMNGVANDLDVKGTALYFIIDLGKGDGKTIVSATSAGHPPLIFVETEGAQNRDFPPAGNDVLMSAPETRHSMLGAPTPPPLGEALTLCRPLEVIIGYTDGILEAGRSKGVDAMFKRRGIIQAATPVLSGSSKTIAETIFERASECGLDDDATVIVIKLKR